MQRRQNLESSSPRGNRPSARLSASAPPANPRRLWMPVAIVVALILLVIFAPERLEASTRQRDDEPRASPHHSPPSSSSSSSSSSGHAQDQKFASSENENPCGFDGLPFGALQGRSLGVPAFSNCVSSFISQQQAAFDLKTRSWCGDEAKQFSSSSSSCRVTGMEWQCVEYARRFLMQRRHVSFANVTAAADIFALSTLHDVDDDKKEFDFLSFHNGGVDEPHIGDLIVYDKHPELPYGHVAVVVDNRVQTDKQEAAVALAEQNWASQAWGCGFSRWLDIQIEQLCSERRFWLMDGSYRILGWKRLGLRTNSSLAHERAEREEAARRRYEHEVQQNGVKGFEESPNWGASFFTNEKKDSKNNNQQEKKKKNSRWKFWKK